MYRSHAGRHFYGEEKDIWAGLGPVGNNEKKNWRLVMRAVFTCLHGSKIGLIKRKIP